MPNNKTKSKRIGIDARFYGPLGKGLGRYTKEIVDRVTRMDDTNEYVVFLSRDNFHEFDCPNDRVVKVIADIRWYTLAEQIRMPRLIKKYKVDLMHFPHFNVPVFCGCPFVVTVHDLILTKFPTQRATTLSPIKYRIKNLGYKYVIHSAVKKARAIIAVSEFTKKDIIQQFRADKNRIKVTYEGVAAGFCPLDRDDKKVVFKYNINKPYLLYVGNAYPHKNLGALIKVMAQINKAEQGLQLILVGKEDYFYNRLKDKVRQAGLSETVLFPGFVPDEDLGCLYRQAAAYVFPSLYEGFGLPPLEAMQHGCPVISSDRASMPEILGKAALYFDPESQDSMCGAIQAMRQDEDFRNRMIGKGFVQASKYNWNNCAQDTLRTYRDAIE